MSHLLFAPLGSGSKGNCYLIALDGQILLVDAGLSNRQTVNAILDLGLDPKDVLGVVLTHGHGDHVRGLQIISEKHDWPIYVNAKTTHRVDYRMRRPEMIRTFPARRVLDLGPFRIEAVPVPHDCQDPVAYRISIGDFHLAICTDLGHETDLIREKLTGVGLMVLEANHDPEMLMNGPYPWDVKLRIRSDHGHLSNVQSGKLLGALSGGQPRRLILGHLSAENNKPELAVDTVAQHARLASAVKIEAATQWEIGPVVEVDI